jgi:hypothetical protein
MINGLVTYAIVSDAGGSCFEGAGFLSAHENHRKTGLKGRLEKATLEPHRSLGTGAELFTHAVIQGKFTARRNERKVVMILNEINRLFGPRPDHVPGPSPPDLL